MCLHIRFPIGIIRIHTKWMYMRHTRRNLNYEGSKNETVRITLSRFYLQKLNFKARTRIVSNYLNCTSFRSHFHFNLLTWLSDTLQLMMASNHYTCTYIRRFDYRIYAHVLYAITMASYTGGKCFGRTIISQGKNWATTMWYYFIVSCAKSNMP